MTSNTILKSPKNLKRRKIVNSLMIGLCVVAGIITILPMLYIFIYTTKSGISSLNLDFFTQLPKPVGEEGGGMANAIVGSIILIGIGGVIGIPVGVLAGVYISEYSKNVLATVIKFTTDILSGVPSIIVGIFAYGIIVIPMQRFSALAASYRLIIYFCIFI
jgi:phosphate transport system permease protein